MGDESKDHSKMLSNRLYQAIRNDELEHVKMYIEQGADVNRQFYSGKYRKINPLALACLRGHEEVMEELLKAGANPSQVSGKVNRPAMFIAAHERVLTVSMMRCLISHGANVNFIDYDGRTILHILASGQFKDTNSNLLSAAKLVLDSGGGSFYARDMSGCTPLYEACKYDNIDLVKLFIAEGADVNNKIGRMTMLRGAAECCNIAMFDLLLNAGANRHLNPDDLIKPCDKNDRAMIAKILGTCDVDINMTLGQFEVMTILHRACKFNSSETVRLLLDSGADVRAVSDTGDTALHYAARTCDCNKIRQLLSYNPPLNIKNDKNQTPLTKVIEPFINSYSLSRRQSHIQDQRDYYINLKQSICLLAFKMLVTAGANVTADDEHTLNQFRIKHPEAQLPDYEIRSTRSLNELCRFVIRGTIPVPVDVSLCKLPIPKILQDYLNVPEFDPIVNKYREIEIEIIRNKYLGSYNVFYYIFKIYNFSFSC